MFAARTTTRHVAIPRALGAARRSCPRQVRFQSSKYSPRKYVDNIDRSHVYSGLAGGLAAGTILYGVFLMTPSGKMHRAINKGAREVKVKYEKAAQQLQGSTPNVDDALHYMKEYCYSYAGWIPGGRQYVDVAFKDVETLRDNHRQEVNQIVSDSYRQFQDLSRMGLSMEAASKAYEVLADLSKKLGNVAGDGLESIMDNHPQVQQYLGGSIGQLKDMGQNYGPEAKKHVDETWQQIKEILGSGFTMANFNKVRQLVEEKTEAVKKLGDEAWKKGLEQARPYLDKNPKVRELLEKNTEALKQGNAKELFDQVRQAVESGNVGNLEKYVNQAVEKAKSKGSQMSGGGGFGFGLDQYFQMIPNGSEMLSKLSQLKEVAEKHSDEGEKLLRETMDELKQVLGRGAEKAEHIVEKAKKDAK
ncbi:hypothetical protein GGR56DRAFT_629952 [Xylariaceae sp. FL0804]|nr:hypothetical protein GGR56DRAFT_629952 [Xylariaceae sp. FL0804]